MPGNRNFSTNSSLSMSPATLAYINRLKLRTSNGFETMECDYSKILALALPGFFRSDAHWCIAPEWVLDERIIPDYYISRIETDSTNAFYGGSYNHLVVETKNRAAISWWGLLKGQAWDQCDHGKNYPSGTIFFIGLIGFEICFFNFNINDYPSHSGNYTNFSPINKREFTTLDLDALDIKYITELNNNIHEIRVIKWRLDDTSQHIYIDEMFNHILEQAV